MPVSELFVLAQALRVPPIALILPADGETIEIIPGRTVTPWEALQWLTGRWPLSADQWANSPAELEYRTASAALTVALDHDRYTLEASEALKAIERARAEGDNSAADEVQRHLTRVLRMVAQIRERMASQHMTPPPLPAAIKAAMREFTAPDEDSDHG